MCCFRDSYERLRGSRELGIPQRCPRCLAGLTAPDHEDENADASDADAADDGELDILQQCHSPSWHSVTNLFI